MAVLRGTKTFTLYPPTDAPFLYAETPMRFAKYAMAAKGSHKAPRSSMGLCAADM